MCNQYFQRLCHNHFFKRILKKLADHERVCKHSVFSCYGGLHDAYFEIVHFNNFINIINASFVQRRLYALRLMTLCANQMGLHRPYIHNIYSYSRIDRESNVFACGVVQRVTRRRTQSCEFIRKIVKSSTVMIKYITIVERGTRFR